MVAEERHHDRRQPCAQARAVSRRRRDGRRRGIAEQPSWRSVSDQENVRRQGLAPRCAQPSDNDATRARLVERGEDDAAEDGRILDDNRAEPT